MRLVVFGSGHPFRGGIARTTTELVRVLEGRGHDVLFLTPSRQYPKWLYPGPSDKDPGACPRLECSEAVLDPLNPFSWPAGKRRALAAGADAWIVPYWTWAWAGWWRYLLHGRRPIALAVAHNPADHDAGPVRRLAARSVLARCQAIFTHARALEAGLARAYPGVSTASHPLPPTTVARLPGKSDSRAGLNLPPDRRVALFMGLIRPYKGVDLLIDAMAQLADDSDWVLLVAGEPWGELGPAIQDQVQRLALEDRVRLMLQWVPETEVPQLLAAADLVVAALPGRFAVGCRSNGPGRRGARSQHRGGWPAGSRPARCERIPGAAWLRGRSRPGAGGARWPVPREVGRRCEGETGPVHVGRLRGGD